MQANTAGVYRCKLADGTGTAGPYLTPFLQAWADSVGIRVEQGTLNLCADREVELPPRHIPLRTWDYALSLEFRKQQAGYDPRLYEVILQGSQRAWLFRWSDIGYLRNFVGDTQVCVATHRCEVVAEVNLTQLWNLQAHSTVTLTFR